LKVYFQISSLGVALSCVVYVSLGLGDTLRMVMLDLIREGRRIRWQWEVSVKKIFL